MSDKQCRPWSGSALFAPNILGEADSCICIVVFDLLKRFRFVINCLSEKENQFFSQTTELRTVMNMHLLINPRKRTLMPNMSKEGLNQPAHHGIIRCCRINWWRQKILIRLRACVNAQRSGLSLFPKRHLNPFRTSRIICICAFKHETFSAIIKVKWHILYLLKYWDSSFLYQSCPKRWTSPFILPFDMSKNAGWVGNIADPDQTPRSDLSLRCLLRSDCPNTWGFYGIFCCNSEIFYANFPSNFPYERFWILWNIVSVKLIFNA